MQKSQSGPDVAEVSRRRVGGVSTQINKHARVVSPEAIPKAVCRRAITKVARLALLLLVFVPRAHSGESVRLAWNPSPSPQVTGYWLYMGASSGSYTNRADTGNVTNTVAAGLQPGATYFFMVTAHDDAGNESVPSNEVFCTPTLTNSAPVLATTPDQLIDELSTLIITIIATDPDIPANVLNYALLSAPAGATLNPLTGVFTWTPTEAQGPSTNTVTLRVFDDGSPSLSATQTFSIIVREVNSAPVLAAIPDQSINELSTLTVTMVATDSDIPANVLTYALLSAPAGATLNPLTGVFIWTPTEAQRPSTNTVTVRVFDDGSPSLSATKTFGIIVREVNSAPVLTAIPDQSIDELSTLTVTIVATDPDIPANVLTYALLSAPAGATLNPLTAVFTWTPTEAQGPSTNTVTVRAFDDGSPSMSATQSFSITVREANSAPVLAAIPDQVVAFSNTLYVTASATDPDIPTNVLTFDLVSAPGGATLDPLTGAFTWTPTDTQALGTNTITVRVYDNGTPSGSATQSFKVVVTAPNSPPTISSIADRIIARNSSTAPIPFLVGDADTSATKLLLGATCSNTNLVPVAGIVFGGSGSNRTVTVVPAGGKIGKALITLLVSDGLLWASNSFQLTVAAGKTITGATLIAPPPQPATSCIAVAGPSTMTISWSSVPGTVYRVSGRQVDDTNWTDLSDDIIALDNVTSWSDQTAGDASNRLYRIAAAAP